MEAPMTTTIKVRSHHSHPLALHLDKFIDVGFGLMEARQVGSDVVLRPGVNEVDADFWNKWHEQHKDEALASAFMALEEPGGPLPRESPPSSAGLSA
jgi:hypothetical protein